MKRNDELLRSLLFEFEADDDWMILLATHIGMTREERTREGHVLLLCDAGFVADEGDDTYRLSSQGHDYLDAIRDEGVWKKTTEAAARVGGVGLGIMKDIAVAFLKQKVTETLGIAL